MGDRHWALGIGNRRTLGRRRLTPQIAFCTSHFAFFPPALCPHPPSVKQGKATSAASAASARPIHHAQRPALEGLASGEAADGNLLSQRQQRQHGGWQRQQSRGRGICPGNVAGTRGPRGLQPQFRSLIQPRCFMIQTTPRGSPRWRRLAIGPNWRLPDGTYCRRIRDAGRKAGNGNRLGRRPGSA